MDSLERKILAAFDRPGRAVILRGFWGAAAVSNAVAQTGRARVAARGGTPGAYALTEDGRLATGRSLERHDLFAPRMPSCEEAKAQIAPLLKEFGARLTEINIDEDAQLRTLYDYDVPVIFLGARRPPSIASISFNFAASSVTIRAEPWTTRSVGLKSGRYKNVSVVGPSLGH